MILPPSLKSDTQRGDEIREWLLENPIDDFIILDDDSDMCEFLNTDHFIKTTYEHGLTEDIKELAIKKLKDR